MASWWVAFIPYLASKHDRPTNPVKGLLCSGNVFSESFQTILDFGHDFGYWILDFILFSTASHLIVILLYLRFLCFIIVFSIQISKLIHLSYFGMELLESL